MTTEICDICDIANCAHIREPKLHKWIAELIEENRRLRQDNTQDALLIRAVQEALEAAARHAAQATGDVEVFNSIRALDPDEIVKKVKMPATEKGET